MDDLKQKGPIKNIVGLLTRWLSPAEQADAAGAPQLPEDLHQSDQVEDIEIPEPIAEAEISRAVLSISEKLSILKESLDFDGNLKLRLDEVRSYRELLLYVHEVLLSRFAKLHEIGLITRESFQIVQHLGDKTISMLSERELSDLEESGAVAEELRRENDELRKEVAELHKKYVRTGIVTETELTLDREVKFLQSRVREQQTRINLATKKIKALIPYQEMAQSLRARNSILQSRVDHQARLLRSLAAHDPKHQELVSTVEELRSENRQLKKEIEKQAELLSQLKLHLPPDSRQMLDELIDRNSTLRSELEAKHAQLEGALSVTGADEDLLESIERLTDENTQLRTTLNAHHNLSSYLEDQKTGKGDPREVIEALKIENGRLVFALQEKEQQIQILTSESADRPAVKAYWQLQQQYKELFRESQTREHVYAQQTEERNHLLAQARQRTALIRENQKLKSQLEASARYAEALKKLEFQCATLKKERAEFRTKFEALAAENSQLKQKLSQVTAEHQILIKEYESIFGGK